MSSEKKIWAYVLSTFMVFILLEVTVGQSSPPLQFYDPCDIGNATHESCDVSKHLKCSLVNGTNICVCNDIDGLFYDGTTCRAYAGKACRGPGGSQYAINCTDNSRCNTNVCTCNFNYMKTTEGHCLLTHDAPGCEKDGHCNQHAFLRCSYGTCKCELNNATYVNQDWYENGDDSTCRSLVGADCTRGQPCVDNTVTCNSTIRTCTCDANAGFAPTAERYCLKALGQNCTLPTECASDNCETNKCVCPEGQIEVNAKCYSLPGKSCSVKSDCVSNADCTQGVCKCYDGYSPAGSKCSANHGTDCSITANPEDDVCNSDIYLVCKNETNEAQAKCGCATDYQFDSTLGRCRGYYGALCTPDRESDCVLSTICNGGDLTRNATCQCLPNLFKGEKERVCRAKYGEECSLFGCYDYAHQICSNNSNCACKTEELVVNVDSICVGKVDSACDLAGEMPLLCIDNAVCQPSQPANQTTCKCSTNFHPSENKTVCLQGNGSAALSISAVVISIFFMIVKLI